MTRATRARSVDTMATVSQIRGRGRVCWPSGARSPAMREPGVTSWLRVAVMALSAVLVAACGDRRQENATVHDGIEFGIWIPDDRGQLHFERTLEVPYVAEQAFGWRLEDVVPEAPVHWVERLELPRPPESWEGVLESANVEISEDGRTATTFGTSMPGDEFVGN